MLYLQRQVLPMVMLSSLEILAKDQVNEKEERFTLPFKVKKARLENRDIIF